ncbi:MAG: YdcF family protein [Armatimonadota bacterium]|nr:YdcF family protein [Armatimonadota bacterium]
MKPVQTNPKEGAANGRRRFRFRKFILATAFLLALAAGGMAGLRGWVLRETAPFIFHDLAAVPVRPVAIVFGAKVLPGGVLSTVLRARVDAAISLYKASKVKKLLMTGDNGRADYDEVTAMKTYAVKKGVPPEDVVRDFAGFRTLDSCYRARHIFEVDKAILVTQAFHLPRALFTARHMGIDAVGFVADPGVTDDQLASLERRELLAVSAAVIDTSILHRRPRFEGRVEPLFGDNRKDR